jgi:hypothetical protein
MHRLVSGLLRISFLIAMSCVLALSPGPARAYVDGLAPPNDPKATLGPHHAVWQDGQTFIYRVNFSREQDMKDFTKKPWRYHLTYHDENGNPIDWVSTDATPNPDAPKQGYWARITTTAASPTRLVAPAKVPGEPQPKRRLRGGTGAATVVITDDGRQNNYDVTGGMELVEFIVIL